MIIQARTIINEEDRSGLEEAGYMLVSYDMEMHRLGEAERFARDVTTKLQGVKEVLIVKVSDSKVYDVYARTS